MLSRSTSEVSNLDDEAGYYLKQADYYLEQLKTRNFFSQRYCTSMDCFIQNLLRDKWLSVEGNSFDDNTDEVVNSIEDGDSDCWHLPASDNDLISSMNVKEKLFAVTISDPNAAVGTDASSISLHRRRRHLFVSLVVDNAVFAEARPYVFRRMETNEKQIDRWDANHGTNDNYSKNNDKMSDSRLVIPQRSWKQQHRDSMLAIPKRILSFDRLTAPVISKKKEEADLGHTHGSEDDGIVTTNKKEMPEPLQAFSWNDRTKILLPEVTSTFQRPLPNCRLLQLA
jgi:hypothetical protein